MVKRYIQASSVLVGLLIISSLLSLLFLSKDLWLHQEKSSIGDYQHYLTHQFALAKSITEPSLCETEKKPVVQTEISGFVYRYGCEKQSIFIQPKPTKEKYIAVKNIRDWLDIDTFKGKVSYISSLSELPKSSEKEPKIVIAQNAINERLDENFYGIIITEHYFDITGSKKIYGALYSRFDNTREERNLTFRKAVIDNIENQYAKWHLLPYSRSLFLNE